MKNDRRHNQRSSSLTDTAALMLLVVFTLLVLRLLLAGAELYRGRNEADRSSYQWRTTAHYLSNKLRQLPSSDALTLEPFGDSYALVISEELEGEHFETWVYSCDGWIRELFCTADFVITPESGERVIPGRIVAAELEQGLLTLRAEDGQSMPLELKYALRGGGGV